MWVAGDEVMAIVRDLIANYHPHLADIDRQIAIVFKEKAAEVGDVVIMGKTAKAPAILAILGGETKWQFIITLAADAWQELNDKERAALLDHHLCACRTKENEQNGAITCFVVPPDVSFYRGEIERHGMWRTSGTAPTPNLILELFGPDKNALNP